MKSHKDLDVWSKSIEFVLKVYKITKNFPSDEKFGLISQLRRAAVSIPSNLAEGAARNSNKEFIRFLYVALGSASESETQLIISQKLGYLNDESVFNDLEDIQKMIMGLIKYLKNLLIKPETNAKK